MSTTRTMTMERPVLVVEGKEQKNKQKDAHGKKISSGLHLFAKTSASAPPEPPQPPSKIATVYDDSDDGGTQLCCGCFPKKC